MANTLLKTGITTGNTVEAWHVTQSIDAFSGLEEYDISLSGSLNMTGSITGEPGIINNLTASFAMNALTASFALSGGGGNPFPFTGSAEITGSLRVIGPINDLNLGIGAGNQPSNIAIGNSTLTVNINGYNNVAIGDNSLASNTFGRNNVSIGTLSLGYTTNGFDNIGIGLSPLLNN
jgi:hypothetical protein